ncbi:hypothetical protein Clacol_006878 [Clathrus columnatus]|uniref:F-box domain-containing protein n=1 Tax=Clathrus columnatus TaxID=1419009 RepID=A0AAV5AIE7_9AGAM|nr:hypothetical protein Clacol_006878 [Clathrus columnatus]
MASIKSIKHLEVAHIEIREAIGSIKNKVENASNVNDLSINPNEERELLEHTIIDLAKESAIHLAELKTRLNALLLINRLSVELLAYIILLTNTSWVHHFHPYLRYTWVCRHWRSTLIQNSAFWTMVQDWAVEPFYEELIRRSKSAMLDIQLSSNSVRFISTLNPLFVEESNRICRLRLENEDGLLHLVLLGKRFPSLRRLALYENNDHACPDLSFVSLVPVLLASDHLETLECKVWEITSFDRLAPIFNRIRNLSLCMENLAVAPPLFDSLHNNTKLQTLQIKSGSITTSNLKTEPSHQVILPELQYLLANCSSMLGLFRAPKLSSLDATWRTGLIAADTRALEDFDFLSIKYLYIRGPENRGKCAEDGLCFLGAKERFRCNTLFSQASGIFYEDPFSSIYSRDCFHFSFGLGRTFTAAVQVMSLTLHRLSNLVEVYFLIPHSTAEFEDLIPHIPSVEKLVIQRGSKLLEIIRRLNKNPPPCPRLKELYFQTFVLPRNLEKYPNDVGRALLECLQSRRKNSADDLECIILQNCPPLPDTWLNQLQDLGTEVVTEKSIGFSPAAKPWGGSLSHRLWITYLGTIIPTSTGMPYPKGLSLYTIWDEIAYLIESPKVLLSLALTCRIFKTLIIPDHLEYRHISCDIRREDIWMLLANRPHLARGIRTIKLINEGHNTICLPRAFGTVPQRNLDEDVLMASDETIALFKKSLSHMTALKMFTWKGHTYSDELVDISQVLTSTTHCLEALSVKFFWLNHIENGRPLEMLSIWNLRSLRKVLIHHPGQAAIHMILNLCPDIEGLCLLAPRLPIATILDVMQHANWKSLRRLYLTSDGPYSATVDDLNRPAASITTPFFVRHTNLQTMYLRLPGLQISKLPSSCLPNFRSVGGDHRLVLTSLSEDILSRLVHWQCPLGNIDIDIIPQLGKLESFYLSQNFLPRKLFPFLLKAPNLKRICLDTVGLEKAWTDDEQEDLIKEFLRCSSLTHIFCDFTPVDNDLAGNVNTRQGPGLLCRRLSVLKTLRYLECLVDRNKEYVELERDEHGAYSGCRSVTVEKAGGHPRHWGNFFFSL